MRPINVALSAAILLALANPGVAYAQLSPQPSAVEVAVTPASRTALGLTIYNDNRALVRDTRRLDLQAGVNRIAFRDIAATMRPETAALKSVSGAGFSLIEQNFDFDLLTPNALLRKYQGKEVSVIRTNPATGIDSSEKATVLATNDGVVLRFVDRIETGIPGRIAFGDVPANLRDRPTLSILMAARRAGAQDAELMYLANGIGWKADYAATVAADGQSMNLAGWITLTNQSGTSYENAKLQLVAGTLNRVREASRDRMEMREMAKAMAAPAPPVSEEKLFEYHLYTVDHLTSVLENQTKQVALLSAAAIPIKREYVLQQPGYFWWYQGLHPEMQKGLKPSVFIRFENKDGDLGKPLPAGTVRVYTQDKSGSAQLIGEDALAHTAKAEKIALRMGEAFDITADRVQTEYKALSNRSSQSSYRIELRNADDNAVSVTVREPLGGDWNINASNIPYVKESAGSAVWVVNVPAHGKSTLEYSAVVKW